MRRFYWKKIFLHAFCFFAAIVFSLAVQARSAKLTGIEIQSEKSNDQKVAFVLKGQSEYHYFTLHNPTRLVVDFDNISLATEIPEIITSSKVIKKIRTGSPAPHVFRIVFDLSPSAYVNALQPSVGEDARTINFSIENNHQPNKKASKTTSAQHPKTIAPLRDVVVVIDPGHGGKDPGAIGHHGTKEKTVVLQIANELKRMVDKEPGMRAVMTRNSNDYLSLRQRTIKARENNADLFIAIHADAYQVARAKGASVYALSLKGASSEAARWLAAKENHSELGGVNLGDKDDLLRSVLIDLSQTATISASLEFGEEVLHSLSRVAALHHDRVEQAPFVVLKSPDIPSILVETGFLSNPAEEKKLKDKRYQRQMAQSIMSGVRHYIYNKPPPQTKIAHLSKGLLHYRVASGDSLSRIALHYTVSIKDLRRENQLKGNRIYIGQNLKIPKSRDTKHG